MLYFIRRVNGQKRSSPTFANFYKEMIGPVFFKFTQHKKDDGFGEGDFKALFEPIERD